MGVENSGRRPQPTALKVLRGNPGKRPLNEYEPQPPSGEVVAPKQLSKAARRVWDRIAPICIQMGTLTVADVWAFGTLCELQATLEEVATAKDAEDFRVFLLTTSVDSAGNEHVGAKVHPALRLEGDTSVKLRPYYSQFGLEPSGRSKLTTVGKSATTPASKWDGLIS